MFNHLHYKVKLFQIKILERTTADFFYPNLNPTSTTTTAL